MGVRIGTEKPEVLAFGAVRIGGMAIGSEKLWPEQTVPDAPRLYMYYNAADGLAQGVIETVEGATSYEWGEGLTGGWTTLGTTRTFSSVSIANGTIFRARARNAHGPSATTTRTFVQSNTNPTPLFTPPAAPTLSVAPGSTVLSISISGGGTEVSAYQWRFSTEATWRDVALDEASFVYGTGIRPLTSYTVQARARNRAGVSSAVSQTVTTRSTIAPPPVQTPATPASITFTSTSSSITGTIASVSGATSYEWGTSSSGPFTTISGGGRTFTVTGLTPSTSYTYYARARNSAGPSGVRSGSQSTKARPTVAPTTPPAPTISAESATGFTVTVDQGTADMFRIRYREGTTGSWTTLAYQASNVFTVTGRSAETSHQVEARRRNSAGESPDWSPAATATTTAVPTQPPAAPPAPTISDVSWDRFTVTTVEGGGSNRYRIRWKLATETAWRPVIETPRLSSTLTNQMVGTAYHVQAARRNSFGWSDWSATATATTTAAVPPSPSFGPPAWVRAAIEWVASRRIATIQVTWASRSGVSGFIVQERSRLSSSVAWSRWSTHLRAAAATTTYNTINAGVRGSQSQYRVASVQPDTGRISTWRESAVVTNPGAPRG